MNNFYGIMLIMICFVIERVVGLVIWLIGSYDRKILILK